jgi:hypothetical protein
VGTIQPVALELQTKVMQAVLDGEIQSLQTNLLVVVGVRVRLALMALLVLAATAAQELHQQLQAHRSQEVAVAAVGHLAPKDQAAPVAVAQPAQMEQMDHPTQVAVGALAHWATPQALAGLELWC